MLAVTDEVLTQLWREDCPLTDVTVHALGIGGAAARMTCFPKKAGFLFGVDWAARMFELAGARVVKKGDDARRYDAGEVALEVEGTAAAIHSVYKAAQTVMEYASGIAGRAQAMVAEAQAGNPRAKVAVTRKHFPGTKGISLAAAVAGGAIIHRTGLSDSVLIFDQHRVFVDDIEAAIARAADAEPEKKIAIEADDAEEALCFAKAGCDILQLDHFTPEEVQATAAAVKAVNPKVVLLAAGGVNVTNARAFAAAGADVLVTSSVYFGAPFDVKMKMARADAGTAPEAVLEKAGVQVC